MENLNDTGKMIGTLLLGAIVGAALGVLFAPDKGSNTRSKLMGGAKDMAEDLKQRMLDEAEAFRKRAAELEAKAENRMGDLLANAKSKAEVVKNHS